MTGHLTEAEVETLARAAHEGQTDKAGDGPTPSTSRP